MSATAVAGWRGRPEQAGLPHGRGARRLGSEAAGATSRYDDISTGDRIDPRTLSIGLDDLLPAERLVSIDSGNFMGYPSAYLAVPDEAGFCFTQAFQSIGLGLATAVGAALARPDRLPVAALGDGGFLMGVAELDTAVRLGLPMVVVVYNDEAYGAEVHHFADADHDHGPVPGDRHRRDRPRLRLHGADGPHGRRPRRRARMAHGSRDRPLVIDAKIADDGGSWWLAEAFRH